MQIPDVRIFRGNKAALSTSERRKRFVTEMRDVSGVHLIDVVLINIQSGAKRCCRVKEVVPQTFTQLFNVIFKRVAFGVCCEHGVID
ncbi:hypothetical protein J6590_034846 [Homalodisca vitripennis]|nr:hypothetical protein J6590_034846 [Homalodisca vitripennis]